jgi:hypothetical protein
MAVYTTSYGNTYEFSFERQSDGIVRVYIDRQPSYGSRSDASDIVHRIRDGNRYYICVSEKSQPRTESDAQAIAVYWSKRNDRYIRNGVSFDAPGSTPVRYVYT